MKTSKCSFRPSREFTCLGFVWNTATMKCSVPRDRLWEAQRTTRRLVKGGCAPVPTRDLARFVGKVTAMTRGIIGARRRLLHIQQQLGVAVREGGFTGRLVLSSASLLALSWWQGTQPWERNGAPLAPRPRAVQGNGRSDAATETVGLGGTITMVGQPTLSTQEQSQSRSNANACSVSSGTSCTILRLTRRECVLSSFYPFSCP